MGSLPSYDPLPTSIKMEDLVNDSKMIEEAPVNQNCLMCHAQRSRSRPNTPADQTEQDAYHHLFFKMLCDECSEKCSTLHIGPKVEHKVLEEILVTTHDEMEIRANKPRICKCFYGSLHPLKRISESDDLGEGDRKPAELWLEVRNSIHHIFHQEGFVLNPSLSKNMKPVLPSAFVLSPKSVLEGIIKRLYKVNSQKLFMLIFWQIKLYLLEIKLYLLRELMEVKPYLIFAMVYNYFRRYFLAIKRISEFLELFQTEWFDKYNFSLHTITLFSFQTIIYMNYFFQKSIHLYTNYLSSVPVKSEEVINNNKVILGVSASFLGHIYLECVFSSFYSYSQANSDLFIAFFNQFIDYKLLYFISMTLFNFKNHPLNVWDARERELSRTKNIKKLNDIPYLNKDSLAKDAFNTNMLQLYISLHRWNEECVFDSKISANIPSMYDLKLTRINIKTLFIELFRLSSFHRQHLMQDFFQFMKIEIPRSCYLERYLAYEVYMTDEEPDDEDFFPDDPFFCTHYLNNPNHNCPECECCCPLPLPKTHRANEIRERLRQRLSEKKVKQLEEKGSVETRSSPSVTEASSSTTEVSSLAMDDRSVDDLLQFINGSDGKKTKKKNNGGGNEESTHSKSKKKPKKNKSKSVSSKKSCELLKPEVETNGHGEEASFNGHVSPPVDTKEELESQPTAHKETTPTQNGFEPTLEDSNFDSDLEDDFNACEDVFKPKDIDLDNSDLDNFERELERFKRFCYCLEKEKNCYKPKLYIDVNEIFPTFTKINYKKSKHRGKNCKK